MKTITVKLPIAEAKELEIYLTDNNYPSKSEFIRHLIMQKLDSYKKEKYGWLVLAEKSMKKIWENKEDDKVWEKYL